MRSIERAARLANYAPVHLWLCVRRLALLSNGWRAALSLVLAFLLVRYGYALLQWAILDASWKPGSPDVCNKAAACWSIITTRWRLILFGLYPVDEQWRAALACVMIMAAIVLACMPRFFHLPAQILIWGVSFPTFALLMGGGYFGLAPVSTERWSGLPLTLYIYVCVIILGTPIAIFIALGRRSTYPAIRWVLGFLVDIVRSVPLLIILFSFSLIIPLFLPAGIAVDKTQRVIIGFTIFFACYQSEVIRGGLQSIPAGQDEAARALGLKYLHRAILITLPQALRNTMPMTINQFVISFKETAIIVIVGLFELMAAAKAAFGVPEWNAYYKEVYVFIALIYFAFSFSLSEYGRYLEKRMTALRDN